MSADAITVTSTADATSLKEKITNFVNDYNSMIETMNKLVKEDYDAKYPPLTEEQKADMSEKEIEAWEKKAKGWTFTERSADKKVLLTRCRQ